MRMKKDICNCGRAYLNPLSGICSLCWNEKFPNEKEEIHKDDLLEPKQETLEEAAGIDLSLLCYHDKRNPDYIPYDEDDLTKMPTDCSCDNCFYGRTKLTEQLIRQTEKMPVDILKRIISFGDASPELMETSFIEIYEKSKRWLEQNKKK